MNLSDFEIYNIEHLPCEYAFSPNELDPTNIIFLASTVSNSVTAPHESDISNASEYNYKNSISFVILAISKSSKYVVSYILVYPSPP